MKVALYPSHHCLPFWSEPENPTCLFDPAILDGWTYKKDVWDEKSGNEGPASEHPIMPVLNGLFAIAVPGIMAHVSFIFNFETKTIKSPKRIWVQITTEPPEFKNGLPVVVKDGKVQVAHLWGGDNGTYMPYQLLGKKSVEDEDTAKFWKNFFLSKLREAKEEACKEAERARAEAESTLSKYRLIT